jgi:hypothetical protein
MDVANMKSRWSVLALVLGLAVVLGGCSGRNAVLPEPEAEAGTPIGTITLVPVDPPKRLFTDNRGIPVIGWAASGITNTIWDKFKSADFDTQYADYREQAGAKLTAAVMQELKRRGFTVKLAPAEFAQRDERDSLNFSKFPAGTTVLEMRLDNFAMYSGRLSKNYVPLIDAYIHVATPAYEQDGYLHDAYYMYGGWASKTGDGYILPEEKYAFPSFAALLEQSDLVRESYDDGIKKLAWHLVRDFRMKFKPTVVTARTAEVGTAPASVAKPAPPAAPEKKSTRKKSARKTDAASAAKSN